MEIEAATEALDEEIDAAVISALEAGLNEQQVADRLKFAITVLIG